MVTVQGRMSFSVLDHLDPRTKTNDDFDEEHDREKVTARTFCNSLKVAYRPNGTTREEKITGTVEKIIRPGRERAAEWYQQASLLKVADLRESGWSAGRGKSKELDVSHLCVSNLHPPIDNRANPSRYLKFPRPVTLRPAGCLVKLVDLDDALGEFRQDFKLAAKGFDDLPQR